MKVIQSSLINQPKNQINMYSRDEIRQMLYAFRTLNQVDLSDYEIDEFVGEYTYDLDIHIHNSMNRFDGSDINFDDL